ncbi:MAG: DUF2612 domain-containing protein [Nannocystaceae bacterium]
MAQDIERRDIAALAIGRLIDQYKDSPKIVDLIELFAAEATELQEAQFSVLDGFDLETATGTALDTIGIIIGLPRPLVDAEIFDYFGFAGASGATSFGDLTDPAVGGRFLSTFGELTGQVPMEDEDYRIHIKAKLLRNNGSATPEDILEIVRLVFPDSGVTTVDATKIANIQLVFGRHLSTIEKGLVLLDDLNGQGDRLIPRSAGVSIDYVESLGAAAFGFAGSPGIGFGAGQFASGFP